jgi:predicted phage terminase large subunit-like protein
VKTRPVDAESELRAALVQYAYEDFGAFVRLMWPVLEPTTPLKWGWWMDAICQAVQRQVEGDPAYRWLLVTQPPGTAKSLLCSVFRPAWTLWRQPSRKLFYLSTADVVATRDSRKTRELLRTDGGPGKALDRNWQPNADNGNTPPWWPSFADLVQYAHARSVKYGGGVVIPKWTFADDQDTKINFETSARGARFCLAMGSRLTGPRGDDVVVDDPVDINEIMDTTPETRRRILKEAQSTVDWVLETRVNGPTSTRTIVMQRVDEDDPAGLALRGVDPWAVIDIRMEFDPDAKHNHKLDPRVARGELLCPELWDAYDIARKKRKLKGQYQGQYNQDPKREEGGLIAKEVVGGLRRWVDDPTPLCDEVVISVDCTFKGKETSDRVAIHAWGREGLATFYLLDRDTRHMGYMATKRAIKDMVVKFPTARVILVEDKANGTAVVEDLGAEIPGVVAYNPGMKSKYERAKVALLPALEARNVVLPSESVAPWVVEVEASWVGMRPGGKDDDDVDAASQMMARWGLGGRTRWVDGVLPGVPHLGRAPVGLDGQRWTWGGDGVVAGLAGDALVVLDGSGCQVAVVEGCQDAEWGDVLREWPSVSVGVEEAGPRSRVVLNYLWREGYATRAYKVDFEALREGLAARRVRVRDARLVADMEDVPRSDVGRALAVAWACGVSRGVLTPPGRDRPLPGDRETRLARWGIDPGESAPEDAWAVVAQRVRAL